MFRYGNNSRTDSYVSNLHMLCLYKFVPIELILFFVNKKSLLEIKSALLRDSVILSRPLCTISAPTRGGLKNRCILGYQLARRRRTTTLGTLTYFRHFSSLAFIAYGIVKNLCMLL